MPQNSNQNPQRNPRDGNMPQQKKEGFAGSRVLLWFLAGLFLASFVLSTLTGTDRTAVAYSTFIEQLQKGNVSEVTFSGDDIRGQFKQQYTPPGADAATGEGFANFQTTKPGVDDPQLFELLRGNDVTIRAESGGYPWFLNLLIIALPWVLIFGLFAYANRKVQGQMRGMMNSGNNNGGIFGVGKSKARRYHRSNSNTRYGDVAGLDNAKQDLQEIVDYLKAPERFAALGAEIPKGVLLMGPPGTGKTLLARATAGEAGVPFFSISGSEFIEMFVGVGASRVRDMFDTAKREAPAIIFIDEIDSVGRARGAGLGGGHDEREQTLNQILSEMDGFEPHESVVVVAATNRPDVLDPALTRPGRFDRQITLELPQRKARREILGIHARHVPIGEDVNMELLAARTVGFSGADLKNLVNEAALLAGRKGKVRVEASDFDLAADKIMLGAEREEFMSDEEKRVVAYHEAGHALVAKLLPDTDPLQKVTIIPRGRALGVTQQLPENDRHNFSQRYLEHRVCVSLGGRVSERITLEQTTTGAAQDLKVATQLARKMVCQWGMSDKVGPITFKQGEEHVFLGREITQQKDFSEYTAQVIDSEIQRIVRGMERKAEMLLQENRDKLEAIALALLEHETLENAEIDRLLEEVEEAQPVPVH